MDRGLELEKPISEKFVSFYYNNLAFSIDKLRLLYTDSSRFCVHSSDGVRTYQFRLLLERSYFPGKRKHSSWHEELGFGGSCC